MEFGTSLRSRIYYNSVSLSFLLIHDCPFCKYYVGNGNSNGNGKEKWWNFIFIF
jgi:hypothetical protein